MKGFISSMKFQNILKNKVATMICLVVIIVVVLAGILFLTRNRTSEVDTTYLGAKLEKASELTTTKLKYNGFTKYTDTGVKVLNRSDFLIVYTATARAGIDVKDIKITSDKITKTVKVKLPKAKILDVKVDPSTIKYYDTKFALFNFDSREDANDAQALAEKKAKKELEGMGILESANEQAEVLIRGLLQESIPDDYELKFTK